MVDTYTIEQFEDWLLNYICAVSPANPSFGTLLDAWVRSDCQRGIADLMTEKIVALDLDPREVFHRVANDSVHYLDGVGLHISSCDSCEALLQTMREMLFEQSSSPNP